MGLATSSFRQGTVTLEVGPGWHEYTFDLSVFGVDLRRALWLTIVAPSKPGRFAFQIDDVRLR